MSLTPCVVLRAAHQESAGRPVDTRTLLAKAVFNVTSNFLSGRRFNWEDAELLDLAACSDSASDMEAAGLYNFVPLM